MKPTSGNGKNCLKALACLVSIALLALFAIDEIGIERLRSRIIFKFSALEIPFPFRREAELSNTSAPKPAVNNISEIGPSTTGARISSSSPSSSSTRDVNHTSPNTPTYRTNSALTTLTTIPTVTMFVSSDGLLSTMSSNDASDYENSSDPEVTCKFPVLDPYDKSILKYIDHPSPLVCKSLQADLSFVDLEGYVALNPSGVSKLNETGDLICTVRTVDRARGNNDNAITRGKPINLFGNQKLNFPEADIAEISCLKNFTSIYYNLHTSPMEIKRDIMNASEDQLSIFLFILDSVSLSMFRRHLPNTYKYLTTTMGLRVFNGYTKVADNTYPNMVPILTGRRAYNQEPGMPDEAQPHPNNQFDNWDIIWQHYAKKGYVTSFIEDRPNLGLFHYLARGFKKKPVDHWLRPFFVVRRKSTLASKSQKFCFGNTPNYGNQANISLQLLRKYRTKRSFQYSFYTDMTHDYCCQVQGVDNLFLSFFKTIQEENLLNHTLMIVMSDHGHRFAQLRSTLVGLIEERMPSYGLYLPPWFYKKHPNIDRNIRTNQWRLSAPFDVHQTFWDVLTGNFSGKQLKKGTRGLSQLYEIHTDRNCTQAGIPEHYCVCAQSTTMNVNDTLVSNVANFIIDSVNDHLKNWTKLCANLTLDEILRAESSEVNQKVVHGIKNADEAGKFNETTKAPKLKIVRVLLSAKPSNAHLEASVHVNLETDVMSIPNTISRINKYGDQSKCINDARMRRYCYCKK